MQSGYHALMTTTPPGSLGANLQTIRKRQNISLRAIERASGLTSGYLSQLERGEVSQPTPTSLARVADAYGVDLASVMEWAGYASGDRHSLSPEQTLALKYLGDNPTEREVEAIRAVLDVLRADRRSFSVPHLIDRPMHEAEVGLVRQLALALLREADALGHVPTPLDELTGVARLVYAGEIELSLAERKSLVRKLGRTMLDRILAGLEGMINFRSREIWLKPDLVVVRRRFVHAHELGHNILPVHRQLAYLDDRGTLSPAVQETCEREANQAAIELLAQGPRLVAEADDTPLVARSVEQLAGRFEISLQATARRISEDSAKRRCTITRYRGAAGKLMPPHVYPSNTFAATDLPTIEQGRLDEAAREALAAGAPVEVSGQDASQRESRLVVSAIDTPRARIAVVEARSSRPVFRRHRA